MLLWLLDCQHFDNFVSTSWKSFSTYLTVISTGFVISQIVKYHQLSFNYLVFTQLKESALDDSSAYISHTKCCSVDDLN